MERDDSSWNIFIYLLAKHRKSNECFCQCPPSVSWNPPCLVSPVSSSIPLLPLTACQKYLVHLYIFTCTQLPLHVHTTQIRLHVHNCLYICAHYITTQLCNNNVTQQFAPWYLCQSQFIFILLSHFQECPFLQGAPINQLTCSSWIFRTNALVVSVWRCELWRRRKCNSAPIFVLFLYRICISSLYLYSIMRCLCGCFVGASYEDVSAGAGTLPIHYTGGAARLGGE